MKLIISLFLCIVIVTVVSGKSAKCTQDLCKIANNCCCSLSTAPISGTIPQFVTLSFDDAIQEISYVQYYDPLLTKRKNKDGSRISATFFVPHDYTNYIRVNDLYNAGYEIGTNTISKSYSMEYWQTASVEQLVQEFDGQRQILAKFANIPYDEIIGSRVPNLQLNGDTTFKALQAAKLTYDNSWSTRNAYLFPYTLDYASTQECLNIKCPTESYPKFWEIPINDLVNYNNSKASCNALQGCNIEGTADQIFNWLKTDFEKHYKHGRQPFNLLANVGYFTTVKNGFDGLAKFLDHLATLADVYVVSNKQLLDWMHNAKPVDSYKNVVSTHAAACTEKTCKLPFEDGERYMGSCVPCPSVYPWIGNPNGDAQ